jgi:hypothetical protein
MILKGNVKGRHASWSQVTTDDTSDVTDVALPASATHVAFTCTAITDTSTPRLGAFMTVRRAGDESSKGQRWGRRYDGNTAVVIDPIVFPNPATAQWHYKFHDLTTIYQDNAWTTPVTTPGQVLRSIDNQGVLGTDYDLRNNGVNFNTSAQTGNNTDTANLFDPDGNAYGYNWLITGGSNEVMFQIPTAADYNMIAGGSRAGIWVLGVDDVDSSGWAFEIEGAVTNILNVRVTSDNLQAYAETIFANLQRPVGSANGGLWQGAVVYHHDGGTGDYRFVASQGSAEVLGNEPTVGHTNVKPVIGGPDSGTIEFEGRFYEHAFWEDAGLGNVPSFNRLKQYATAKYGVTFP